MKSFNLISKYKWYNGCNLFLFCIITERVASYKKIRGGVFIVEQLPRGKTGKVVRSMAANISLPPMAC